MDISMDMGMSNGMGMGMSWTRICNVQVLFKGLGPACAEKVPSTAIGYFIYETLKKVLNVRSV